MPSHRSGTPLGIFALALAITVGANACQDGLAPAGPEVRAAKGGGGNGDPVVRAVEPDSSVRDTTLDIQVTGSGFDDGTVVELGRDSVPSPEIQTNATTFVNSKKVIANITIQAVADTGKYDVIATTSKGRKGIGLELFRVTAEYEVEALGAPVGWEGASAWDMNDAGAIVGFVSRSGGSDHRGFVWMEADAFQVLDPLPGMERSKANGISGSGLIAGTSYISDPSPDGETWRATVWEPGGAGYVAIDLGLPFGGSLSSANDVNSAGEATGNVHPGCPGCDGKAAVWTIQGGVVTDVRELVPLPGHNGAVGDEINEQGYVLGGSRPAHNAGDWHGLLWLPDGQIVDLGTDVSCGGVCTVSDEDASGAVRVAGEKISTAKNGSVQTRATVWTVRNGVVVDVRDLGWGGARGLNRAGDVVGTLRRSRNGNSRATLWKASGEIVTLPRLDSNALGWPLAINSAGYIAGNANVWPGGGVEAVRWIPPLVQP